MGQITFVTGPAVIIGEEGGAQWSPVFTDVQDGARIVKQVTDWTGGTGEKPATGMYVGAAGYVENIADAMDFSGDVNPAVSAGAAQLLGSKVTSTQLTGSAAPGAESATITNYLWERVSGPAGNVPVITSPTSSQTAISNLVPGTYVFRLTATDSTGRSSSATVQVKVKVPARFEDLGEYEAVNHMHVLLYRPEGDDDLNTPWPTLLWGHGAAENGISVGGDIWALTAKESPGLPHNLAQGMKFNMRVVLPQRWTGFWTSDTAMWDAWVYAKSIAAVDPNKCYIGGPSSAGGGAINTAAAHPGEFVVVQVAAPVASQGANLAANFGETLLQIFHGAQDATIAIDAPGTTWAIADAVNGLATAPRYSPQIVDVPDEVHHASLWRDYLNDKSRAILVQDEELLMYDKRPAETARNFYNKAARRRGEFKDYAIAAWMANNLPAGADKTELLALLATVAPDNTYFINLGSTENAFPSFAINNAPSPADGATVAALRDIKNNTTALGFTTVTNGGAATAGGMTAALFGLSPLMVSTGFPITTTKSVYKITGIPAGKFVDIHVFYSDRSSSKTTASGFSIDANGAVQGQTRLAPWNSRFTVDLYNVPEIGGEITLTAQAFNAQGGTIIGIAWQIKDSGEPLITARFDHRATAATSAGWKPFIDAPATAVATLVDDASGITMSTVGRGNLYWRSIADGSVFHSDTEGPNVNTYPAWVGQVVGRGSLFNFATQWQRDVQNFNQVFTKAGGFETGIWRLRVFACTANSGHNSNAQYIGKVGTAGQNKQMLQAYNADSAVSTGRWLEFIGEITPDNQNMALAAHINNAAAGVAFLNAIEISLIKRFT